MKYEYKVVVCEQNWRTGETIYLTYVFGSNTLKDQETYEMENKYTLNIVSYTRIK